MTLAEINPFVRFVHLLSIDKKENYGLCTPFDNRLFYLQSGVGAIRVGGRTLSLGAGDALIVPSGTEYELLVCDTPAQYIAVNFDYTQSNVDKDAPVPPLFAERFDPKMRFESVDFSDAEELSSALVISGISGICGKLLRMEDEYGKKLFGYGRLLSGLLVEILVECIREHRAVRFEKSQQIISEILNYVDKNYTSSLSNADVAAAFGLHPGYVSHLIKLQTGLPLHKYLLHLRVSRAMALLGKDGLSVGEVAAKTGFVDIYHFSKTFKRLTGVPPSRYL